MANTSRDFLITIMDGNLLATQYRLRGKSLKSTFGGRSWYVPGLDAATMDAAQVRDVVHAAVIARSQGPHSLVQVLVSPA